MDYKGLFFTVKPLFPVKDILTARLADLGFESFVDTEEGFEAYIPKEEYIKEDVLSLPEFDHAEWEISFVERDFEDQNWNATWEASFHPIEVGDFVRVRAPFHDIKEGFKHEVLIQPQMSFGTGHHQTTFLIMKNMDTINFQDAKVLDMGCGTGILAILAEKLGAAAIDAIDIDHWSFENTKENIELNQSKNIAPILGGEEVIPPVQYDCVIANINRNILQAQLPKYASVLKRGAKLFLSGFFTSDVDVLQKQAADLGIVFKAQDEKEGWTVWIGEKA